MGRFLGDVGMTEESLTSPPEDPNAIPKRPGGRPSAYDPAFCEEVIELGRRGKSRAYMAAVLGVHRETLINWEGAHPEFFDAMAHARALAQAWWEDAGQNGLAADKFNAQVYSRSMAARFPDDWREKQSHELSGKDGGAIPVRFEALTDAQLASFLRRTDASAGEGPGAGGAGPTPPQED
jgi:hypothetical protein